MFCCSISTCKKIFNHNTLVYDAEDVMMMIFTFLLFWLPLHHITIYDRFGTKPNILEDSWPMWPFRLWQFYMSFIYIGAWMGKLVGPPWCDGTALYRVAHTTDFYPGIFNPDFLFNRMWFLYMASYLSLFVEGLGWLLIWPLYTRRITLIIIMVFHVGIDVAMTMHIFEYLTMVGWLVFLVEEPTRSDVFPPQPRVEASPSASLDPTSTIIAEASPSKQTFGRDELVKNQDMQPVQRWWTLRRIVDTFIFLFFFVLFVMDNIPSSDIASFAPSRFQPYVKRYFVGPHEYAYWNTPAHDILEWSGLHGGPWNVFGGYPDDSNDRYEAEIRFSPSVRQESSDQIDIPLVLWKSPDYGSLNGWVKKRHLRNMNYLEYLAESRPAQIALCEYLSRKYTSGDRRVSSVRLMRHLDYSAPVPADLDWFRSPARQPMMTQTSHLYTLFVETFQFDYTDTLGTLDHFGGEQQFLSRSLEPPVTSPCVDENEAQDYGAPVEGYSAKTSSTPQAAKCDQGDSTCLQGHNRVMGISETNSRIHSAPSERSITSEL
jgi:Vitamin K-dependent gamma-carboxylase